MNIKHGKLIPIATAAVLTVSSLSMAVNAYAKSVDSDIYVSPDKMYTDTLELYADDASDDPEYEKYYNAVNSPDVQFNSYTVPSKYSQYKTIKGIDVSKYQGTIDWKKVKAAGVDIAIIRVGFRGYGSGTICADKTFDTNMKNAIAAGVEVGVYFFSQAINESEAKAEAEYCISKCAEYNLTYPIYIDMEKDDTGRVADAGLNTAKRTAIANTFCMTVAESGYIGGVYANKSWLNTKLDSASLQKTWAIWLAHYTNCTNYTGEYDLWQYTSTGSVNGISGAVDMNVYFDKPNSKTKNSSFSVEKTTEETTEKDVVTSDMILSNENLGDVNLDGKVDSKDAVEILKYYAETIVGKTEGFTEEQKAVADVDYNGEIGSVDSVWILKYFAYNITSPGKTFGEYLVEEFKAKEAETTEPSETMDPSETSDSTDSSETNDTANTDSTENTDESTDETEISETDPTETVTEITETSSNK